MLETPRLVLDPLSHRFGTIRPDGAKRPGHGYAPHEMHSTSDREPRDVVLSLCFVTWEDGCRRGMHFPPDRLIETLVDSDRVRRLVVVDPYRDRMRTYAKRALGRTLNPVSEQDLGRVRHVRPLRLRGVSNPVRIDRLERLYTRWDRLVEEEARAAGLEQPAVITTNPFVAGFAPLRWAGPVTYYVWDDWVAQPGYRPWRQAFRESYDRVHGSGRRMCAVSQEILERARPSGPTQLVPNGVDPAEWDHPRMPPAWFSNLPGPRLLYAGTLDGRIDADLVAATAQRFPSGSIVLIGLIADPEHLAPLAKLRNVHVRPPVSRAEIASLIRASDACLVPHARTEQTSAMSPLKLYEYVAAGRPVAAVDLPPMREIDPRVVLVAPGDDYAAAVERALAQGPAPESERLAFIDRHSWRRRHDEILDLAFS
jgi:glycosyltransferase involved in cell wall biosynthesis